MFELFEHTADFGLRIRAATLDELFAEAGMALTAALVENPGEIRPLEEHRFDVPGDHDDELLHDWLVEVLFAFSARRVVFAQFQVALLPGGLTAVARGELIDLKRHRIEIEIKAITYHGLKVEPVADGWLAEVIVDI